MQRQQTRDFFAIWQNTIDEYSKVGQTNVSFEFEFIWRIFRQSANKYQIKLCAKWTNIFSYIRTCVCLCVYRELTTLSGQVRVLRLSFSSIWRNLIPTHLPENIQFDFNMLIFLDFFGIRIGQRDTKCSIVSTCYSHNNTYLACVMFYYVYLVIRYEIRYRSCAAIINASISSFSPGHFTLQLAFVIYGRSVLLDSHREKYFRSEKVKAIFLNFFYLEQILKNP